VDRDQEFLLSPDMAQWLPEDHLVWFVIDVVDQLDTQVFHARHPQSGPGRAAYDPEMLLALLIYAYAVGERSSRRVEALCHDHVAFRVLCAQDVPDHTTIARFRAGHEALFADLFGQVLMLCAQAGMGKVGVVAIDGTKIAANASLGANRGEESLRQESLRQESLRQESLRQESLRQLAGELAGSILAEAAQVDAAEDAEHGDARGDELPPSWADRSGRKERIRRALEEIEEQQGEAEEADRADRAKAEEYLRRVEAGESVRGNPPNGLDPVRLNKARLARAQAQEQAAAPGSELRREARRRVRKFGRQLAQAEQDAAAGLVDPDRLEGAAAKHRRRRGKTAPSANTTDPDSRKMGSLHGFVQGFNAQIAVSDDHLILATALSQNGNDNSSFEPMMNAAVAAAATIDPHTPIGTVLADAGYFSQHNLTLPGPARLIAYGKNRDVNHHAALRPALGPPPPEATTKEQMRHRLRTEQGQQTYKRRSATVETVIAHLKDQVGLRRFSRRGLTAAASELHLAAAVVNLRRLHGQTGLSTA
jgi:transposase